jgi:P-type E1-E2 ATPase
MTVLKRKIVVGVSSALVRVGSMPTLIPWVITSDSLDRAEVLRLAAATEWSSEHPLGKAIVAKTRKAAVIPTVADDFEAIPGYSVQARVYGRLVRLGQSQWLLEHGIALNGLKKERERLAQEGQIPMYLAADAHTLGVIAVADILKPSARSAVEALQAMVIDVAMITGDNALPRPCTTGRY